MSREDIDKLLGGYATGTLTAEEQQALFAAALEDQELFDALAREQALREVLDDPAARAHLLAAIDDVRVPWYRRLWRPVPMTVMAMASLVLAVGVWQISQRPQPLPRAKLVLPAPHVEPPPVLPPPPEMVASVRNDLSSIKLPAKVQPVVPRPLAQPVAAPAPPPAAPAVGVVGGVSGASSFQAGNQERPAPATFGGLIAPAANGLRGTVTDRRGAAIAQASVEVKELSTGTVSQVSTDSRGQFQTGGVPGQPYEVKASAPGFQATTARVTPAAGASEPVNLRLDVGALAESVTVQASAVPMQAPMMQSQQRLRQDQAAIPPAGFAGNMVARAGVPPRLQYQAMRRLSDGTLVAIPAAGRVATGDAVVLEVTSRASGTLEIRQGLQMVASRDLTALRREDIDLPVAGKQGRLEFELVFLEGEPKAEANAAVDAASKDKALKKDAVTPFRATLVLTVQ